MGMLECWDCEFHICIILPVFQDSIIPLFLVLLFVDSWAQVDRRMR